MRDRLGTPAQFTGFVLMLGALLALTSCGDDSDEGDSVLQRVGDCQDAVFEALEEEPEYDSIEAAAQEHPEWPHDWVVALSAAQALLDSGNRQDGEPWSTVQVREKCGEWSTSEQPDFSG